MASPSPAVLLKLLVLEEEREMLARPFSFNLMKGFSLLGQISGELGEPQPGGCRHAHHHEPESHRCQKQKLPEVQPEIPL